MDRIDDKASNIELQIRGIELLNSSLELPANPQKPITNFNFNIGIESRIDAQKKLVFVIVHVEVNNEDQSVVLGSLSVSNIFEIVNFADVVKIENDEKFHIPQTLIETLNSVSISTTRGIMFSTFKGTLLHSAVLPIISPKQFQIENRK